MQMQKDYLRRKARRPNTSTSSLSSPIDGTAVNPTMDSSTPTSTKPAKSKAGWFGGTSGSIKDGSGHEVENERVVLYIHGTSACAHRFDMGGKLTGRRCILLFIPRYAQVSSPATRPQSGRSSLLACLSAGATVPLRTSLRRLHSLASRLHTCITDTIAMRPTRLARSLPIPPHPTSYRFALPGVSDRYHLYG